MSDTIPQNVGNHPSVLVVEDEFMVALDIQAMLKRNGYKVRKRYGSTLCCEA